MSEIPPYFQKVCQNMALDGMCSKLSLSGFSTAELMAELKTRPHDELCPVLDEAGQPICVFITPTKALVKELASRKETTIYEVEEGQQCSIQINNEVVDFTNRMPAAWILEVVVD